MQQVPLELADDYTQEGWLQKLERLTQRFPMSRSNSLIIAWLIYGVVCIPGLIAQEASLPAKERFHLFLLVGQSNMAGRGLIDEQDQRVDPRVLMLTRELKWVPAVDPLHFDKPAAGVGLGKTFGRLVAEQSPEIVVGLIPCAVGGSPIDAWLPGAYDEPTKSHPWDDALRRAAIATQSGTLRGILWHQGESDSTPELAEAYAGKLIDLVARFRQALASPELPFLVGQLGQFADAPWTEQRRIVDAAHRALPGRLPGIAFVPSDGLGHKGDKVHFDAAALREFGRRYAKAYFTVRTPVIP